MKQLLLKTAALGAGLLISGTASAHAGTHGAEGFWAGTAHMMAEHGYLLAIAGVGVGIIVLKRSQRV